MNAVFEALAHPTRRAILELLKHGARNAGDLATAFDISKPTLSAHLVKLSNAKLIQASRKGTMIFYSINLSLLEEVMMGFLSCLNVKTDVEQTRGFYNVEE